MASAKTTKLITPQNFLAYCTQNIITRHLFLCTYAAGVNSSITQHAFSYLAYLQLPSEHLFEYKTSEEGTRSASSVDKDEEDAIASSGNNGDRLMENQKPKSGVFLRGYSVNLVT